MRVVSRNNTLLVGLDIVYRDTKMTTKILIVILSLLLLGAIIGVITLYIMVPPDGELSQPKSTIAVEAAKSLFQLIVVVLIGGTVTALFKAFETSQSEIRMREEEWKKQVTFESDIRADFLKRVGTSYRVVKNSRRSLRAAGLTNRLKNPPATLSSDQIVAYQEHMQIINEAQLDLEALKIEASSLPTLVRLQQLSEHLQKMEQYLGKIIKEYEEVNPILLTSPKDVKFDEMAQLKEFTGSINRKDPNGFEKCLAKPHDKVIKIVADRSIMALDSYLTHNGPYQMKSANAGNNISTANAEK